MKYVPVILASLAGCASSDDSVESTDATIRRDGGEPFVVSETRQTDGLAYDVVRIRSRSRDVLVRSSAFGPLFTVLGTSGEVVAEELSLVELQDRHPDVYHAYRDSLAGSGTMYAGLRAAEIPPEPQAVR